MRCRVFHGDPFGLSDKQPRPGMLHSMLFVLLNVLLFITIL